MKIETIYKVTEYVCYKNSRKAVRAVSVFYHQNNDDVLRRIKRITRDPMIYCIVVTRLPVGLGLNPYDEENLSEQVYDSNGNLFTERPFAVIHDNGHEGTTSAEWMEWLLEVRHFEGWRKEQLKFSPGDIVDIHCRPGNRFFSPAGVIPGIIVSLPNEYKPGIRDCYGVMTLDAPGSKDYAPVTTVLPTRFPIRKATRDRLVDSYKKHIENQTI